MFTLLLLGDLDLEYFDLLMLLKDLRIECLMIGCLLHPVAQLLNLLLFLREGNLWGPNHTGEATGFQRGRCRQVCLSTINLSRIHDGLTDTTFAYLVVFDSLSNLILVNGKCLLFQELGIGLVNEVKKIVLLCEDNLRMNNRLDFEDPSDTMIIHVIFLDEFFMPENVSRAQCADLV